MHREEKTLTNADVSKVQRIAQAVRENVGRVIVGKEDVIDLLLVALLCEGHVLLEDVPGIGKTTLAKTLARSLGCTFQRIQFTPDLLPSDITGVNVFNQKTGEFEYRPGPVMAQIVLADEINRAGPRTQSALLEAMEERQVTVDGVTRPLPRPFFVLATQNPIELEGTFPLPEAQIDRFLMRVALGYPDREEERQILRRFRADNPLDRIEPVVTADELQEAGAICREVYVHPALEDYLLDLVRASRSDPAISLGISPRGSLALHRTSQALAAIQGRGYVIPDDIKRLAKPVLAHRLILSPDARLRGRSPQEVLDELMERIPVPVEEVWQEETPA
ncbi:MAG TPA: MoxR family ATPase [Caldilineae bacterium]|nr:MoxR family ATPase [Caldilineae bacterium]